MTKRIIAKLNKKITFQKAEIKELKGGDTETKYQDVITVWAEVKQLNAKETIDLYKINSTTNKKIFIRFIKGLDTTMRIKIDGEFFNIISIENIENKNAWLVILTETFKR